MTLLWQTHDDLDTFCAQDLDAFARSTDALAAANPLTAPQFYYQQYANKTLIKTGITSPGGRQHATFDQYLRGRDTFASAPVDSACGPAVAACSAWCGGAGSSVDAVVAADAPATAAKKAAAARSSSDIEAPADSEEHSNAQPATMAPVSSVPSAAAAIDSLGTPAFDGCSYDDGEDSETAADSTASAAMEATKRRHSRALARGAWQAFEFVATLGESEYKRVQEAMRSRRAHTEALATSGASASLAPSLHQALLATAVQMDSRQGGAAASALAPAIRVTLSPDPSFAAARAGGTQGRSASLTPLPAAVPVEPSARAGSRRAALATKLSSMVTVTESPVAYEEPVRASGPAGAGRGGVGPGGAVSTRLPHHHTSLQDLATMNHLPVALPSSAETSPQRPPLRPRSQQRGPPPHGLRTPPRLRSAPTSFMRGGRNELVSGSIDVAALHMHLAPLLAHLAAVGHSGGSGSGGESCAIVAMPADLGPTNRSAWGQRSSNTRIIVSGPPGFVDTIEAHLKALGVPAEVVLYLD
ncbi:hypothetical protein JKP88DRAFT_246307 [Tribonema minus]|uniref:Uncharacterized protein n=1 Tax=Tribonema minus TaxID=303371 RepID=A0A836CCA5_9STRA|nr:hypothetical protein JKP88DRAFT_246307 [Tribonema minus]